MPEFYYLKDDHTYEPCEVETWSNQIKEMGENDTKHVGIVELYGKRISTVWLGLDHNHLVIGEPLLFETMIFDENGDDIYMKRYTTWDEAVEGHKEAVDYVKKNYN